MSDSENSWDALTDAWRSSPEAPPPADIGAELRKRRALTLAVVLGELGITAGLVGVTVWLQGDATIGPDAVFLGGLWSLWLVATCFAWWTRLGQTPNTVASPEEFVRLSLERARRKQRIVWFSLGLLAAQVAFAIYVRVLLGESDAGLRGSLAILLVFIVAAHLLWARWYYRRAKREQVHFAALHEAFEGETG